MKDEYYVDSFTGYKIDFIKQTKYLIVNCVELMKALAKVEKG